MSHWRSGLPELPMDPYDATDLYRAAGTPTEPGANPRRRRRVLMAAVAGVILVLGLLGALVAHLI
ncbi:MAG: hypothetical protein ACRCYX_11470 [Dermatophilaceae bacterium]